MKEEAITRVGPQHQERERERKVFAKNIFLEDNVEKCGTTS